MIKLPYNFAINVHVYKIIVGLHRYIIISRTTVASILYSSAWYGFANEGDLKRLDRLIARPRMRRCGYLPWDFPCLVALIDEVNGKLFRSISHNFTHVLRH